MSLKLKIEPQDKSKPEKREFTLHPEIVSRLDAYAASLESSDVNYVLGQILEQVLPNTQRGPGRPTRPAGEKKHRETPAVHKAVA